MLDMGQALAGRWTDGTRPADLVGAQVGPESEWCLPQIGTGLVAHDAKARSGCAELLSLVAG